MSGGAPAGGGQAGGAPSGGAPVGGAPVGGAPVGGSQAGGGHASASPGIADAEAAAGAEAVADAPSEPLPAEAARWVERLRLEPLAHEGGLFRQMHLDAHSSAIYYLLARPDFSALHALASTEVYHWYAGSPLRLLLLHPDGRAEERLLGPDADAGQLPQLVVPPGVMQGSSPAGDWSLVGTTMSPPFDWDGFVLGGDRAALQERYPDAAGRIAELTR
ncbi:cupin domain-containing protein [Leucobacter allii]|uniref:Cupin domain-containing protein n=1 Tax=Leucobacter allii TaxID=2932247 RepID=A0ABY4FKJ4_9MICO|nr:cupin domain-containing protein [Leucobacter allii]UOQ56246.1 cupin domain-containing protein [Leucobacter allii]